MNGGGGGVVIVVACYCKSQNLPSMKEKLPTYLFTYLPNHQKHIFRPSD